MIWSALPDLVDYGDDVFDWGSGDDAVAEVEDVAGAASGSGEDFLYAGVDDVLRGEEGDWVEVALDGTAGACGLPAFSQRDAPVETEDIGSGLAEGGEERGGVHAEVDDWDTEGADTLDEFGGGGEAVLAVVGDRERAGPGVEDLDDVGSGFDLLLRVGDEGR